MRSPNRQIEGPIFKEQTDAIAELLERYKNTRGINHKKPEISDYTGFPALKGDNQPSKRHDSDYYLYQVETDQHYLIELKIGGDLDNKKARSEKEALLEQYFIFANKLGKSENIHIYLATGYNRDGEGREWKQGRVLQFFAEDELLISRDFWNFVCQTPFGYDIVIDEYRKNAHFIIEALAKIKSIYLPD